MPAAVLVPNRCARNVARRQHVTAWVASLLVVALISACSLAKLGGKGGPQGTVAVVVENRGYSDVNVYVVRSEGARGARLGTVNGGATVTLTVRETDLQAGGLLQLQARAIGGRSGWTSPSLYVSAGSVVKLDLIAIGTTDLSQSQIYVIQ
jgi:hypothetical protein